MLDFGALSGDDGSGATVIEPRKIFTTLVRHPRFKFPSDNQGEVLDKWFDKRLRRDNTLKMNTGSGKMLVGLMILKSALNEGVGPALYVTPDNYLNSQVLKEAAELGIAATDDPRSAEYLSGEAVAVINVDKLINGKSIFGVGSQGVRIPIGTVVVDDAHACLESVENQFSIRLKASSDAYLEMLSLFNDDLNSQSDVGLVEIKGEDPNALMSVPFWSWIDKRQRVLEILHAHRNDDALQFSWPLLKEVLTFCRCVFGGGWLEIAPRCLPIEEIPSFSRAKRRIYMTATLADDGVLISHLAADPVAIADPIKPKGAGEIGDRMIIAPQEVNDKVTEADIKSLAVEVAKTRNVVVIVPSRRRSEFWKDVASQTLTRENIGDGISRLKDGKHVGLTVLVNRYDGVDLPEDACRLLIIDGSPEVHGLIDRTDASLLENTEAELLKQMQRLEQGMGRGVRSGEDRCAVLLLGSRLTQRINQADAKAMLTPATLAQMEMGREVTRQLKGKPIGELRQVLDLCIERNNDAGVKWWQAGRRRLANAPEGKKSHIDPSVVYLRTAFDAARSQQFTKAIEAAQLAVNSASDPVTRGSLKQVLAEYTHHVNPAQAQQLLLAAIGDNRRVLKPLAGIAYSKISSPVKGQASAAMEYMARRFIDTNAMVLFVNALADDLAWDKHRTEQFEAGMLDLGLLLGFGSQRPDKEYRDGGPDNLWAVGDLKFFVIECKSGVDLDGRPISKDHCNQLLGSLQWFRRSYDGLCKPAPLLVHPVARFQREASPAAEMRIVDTACLAKLKTALKAYAAALASFGTMANDVEVARQLDHFSFTGAKFLPTYTTNFKVEV